ncbi:hypothetical protein O6H91_16G054100 [Diphasiastrum complanatum]|uniref:Uncharacterized protein n=1 Tax=Diphasiastrum complanatum TaxID=34168 RepID=A0ACC2BCK8_DIPCM|nr:hypothetical protein O6H91_16G054100 [Diphasiastrum complanatum]
MIMDCRQNRTLRMAIENKFSLKQAKYGWLSTTLDGKTTRLSKLRGVWKENLLRMAQFKSLMTPVLLVAFGMFMGALAISQVTRYHAAQKFLFYDTTVNFNLHSKPSNHIVPELRNDVHPNASSNNYSQMRTESVIHPEVRNDVHPNASSNNYSQMRTESVIHPEVGNDIPSNASSSSDNVHTNASSSSIDNVDPNASSTDILHPINANSIDHTHPNASITNIHPNASMSKCIRPPTSEDWHWKGFPMQHNLTDAELFTMASIDPRVVGRPEKYIPKLAFMFLTHGPLPLRPLWEEFFKGHEKYFSIYVHSNPESTQDFEQPSFFHGRMIPSQVSLIMY